MTSKSSGLTKPKKLLHIGQYEIGRTLGEGSFSKVKLGTDVFTGKKYAIKIVDWSLVDDIEDQTECVDREIKIMKLLDHPNIVKLYDIISHKDDKKTFLVLEYVSRGELFDYIVANGRIKEAESRKFWRQLVSAVEYTHAFLVVHRDLKPSNLLLASDGSIKITDFGLSNTMTPGKLFTTWCGSLYYSAPEIVEEKKYTGPAVDIWSMGVILYALVNGRLPWSGRTDLEKIRQIVVADMSPLDRDISSECADLIKACLTVDAARRITVPQIRLHPWTNIGFDGPPPCLVPQTTPVAKVSDSVIEQLIFLGILDPTDEKIAAAKADVQNNVQNQLVFAYHILLKKPQLLVSASFLPRDKIKQAVSKHRLAESQKLAAAAAAANDVDGDAAAAGDAPPPPPPTSSSTAQKEIDELSSLLTEIEPSTAPTTPAPPKPAAPPMRSAKTDVDLLADDLDALSEPPAPASASPGGKPVTAAARLANATTGAGRRRSRTVSAGTGNSKAPKMADVLKLKLHHAAQSKAVAAVDDAIAQAAAPRPLNAAVARSSAAQADTRPRSASMGQKTAEKPPPPPAAAPTKEKSSVMNLFKRKKKSEGKTAGSTWDPSMYADAKTSSSISSEMRTVKGVFKCATTSTHPPSELLAAVETALVGTGVVKWKRKSDWLFRCAEKKSKVRLEIEVVQIERMPGVYGIRFARLSGDTFLYKNICEQLMT